MKMLVYNKNEKARAVVGRLLKELGFNVLLADTEKSLLEYLKTESLDIALLDIESMEDFRKSIDNILKYKKRSYFLIAIEETDRFSKIEALLKGIDDYIYNDFNLEELSAKVRAIIRVLNKRLTEDDMGLLTVYDLTLNPLNREVRRAGNEIELTNKEFLLLEYFLRNKNRVLTRSMISEKIWDIDFVTASNIVDVYINFLRAKIDKSFSKKIIKTVRSVGYIVKE